MSKEEVEIGPEYQAPIEFEDHARILRAADELYHQLALSPCRCCTKWEAGKRHVRERCPRCKAIDAYATLRGVPTAAADLDETEKEKVCEATK